MAVIPLLPKEGLGLIHKNMREARSMECREIWPCRKLITGSIKKSGIVGHGITNSKTGIWQILAILIMAQQGLPRVYLRKRFIWERVLRSHMQKRRVHNGVHGMANFPMVTTRAISFGLNRE